MHEKVLVLNKAWKPISFCTVERAFGLLVTGAAKALSKKYEMFNFDSWAELAAEYGDSTIATANRAIVIPKILILQSFSQLPELRLRFSRANIYARDNYHCAYCGRPFPKAQLNLDHVIPRAQGGTTNWGNIVASCVPCNSWKGARTPEQAGMRMFFQPYKPTWNGFALQHMKDPPEEWKPFLDVVDMAYWNAELVED